MKKEEIRFRTQAPKLELGHHTFTYQADTAFFEQFGTPLFSAAEVQITVQVHKTDLHYECRFTLAGSLQLSCDRCLEPYSWPFQTEALLVYSHDEAMQDTESDEVVYVPRHVLWLDFSQDLYDFVSLQVPLRQTPPDCPGPKCPPEVLRLLNLEKSHVPNFELTEFEKDSISLHSDISPSTALLLEELKRNFPNN
jgi:uncharacterized metal-binding protein YceD (DUF177 family)